VNNINKVIAICHSNRDVNYWNNWIRQKLGLSSSILANNDIIVTQNTWLNNCGDWVYKGEYWISKKKADKKLSRHFIIFIFKLYRGHIS
jgi:hypothetical protein